MNGIPSCGRRWKETRRQTTGSTDRFPADEASQIGSIRLRSPGQQDGGLDVRLTAARSVDAPRRGGLQLRSSASIQGRSLTVGAVSGGEATLCTIWVSPLYGWDSPLSGPQCRAQPRPLHHDMSTALNHGPALRQTGVTRHSPRHGPRGPER